MHDTVPAPKGIMPMCRRFTLDEDGATAIEYGLIAALVCVAVIASVIALGNNLTSMWNYISDTVNGALTR